MAEVLVLLLGEIDLSVGYNAGVGAVATLWAVYNLPWPVAIVIGLAVTAFFGLLGGLLITAWACRRSWSPWPACSAWRGCCS